MIPSSKSFALAGLAALLLATAATAQTAPPPSFGDGVAAAGRADYASALTIFRAAADRGDAKSEFALAEMFRQGQGVRSDPAQALNWYRKAAEQGLPGAEFALGRLYQTGEGARRDDRQAAGWYAKAAGHGYASAQVQLGALYTEGRGVPKSDETAIVWFRKAADQGDPDGQAHLATMNAGAEGPPRQRFFALMDRIFGAGRWRETSGYRSPAQENQLRKQGAGTVPTGQRSHHSMGDAKAPGAYDIVVAGMSPERAVARLRLAKDEIARAVAEFAHGNQGPHLHVEPRLAPAVSNAVVLASLRPAIKPEPAVKPPISAGLLQQTANDGLARLLAASAGSPAPRN